MRITRPWAHVWQISALDHQKRGNAPAGEHMAISAIRKKTSPPIDRLNSVQLIELYVDNLVQQVGPYEAYNLLIGEAYKIKLKVERDKSA